MMQFGEWLPDQPNFMNQGVSVATNVVPILNGYSSLNQFVAYSEAADNTLLNVFSAKADTGDVSLFAGDAGKLYRHNATTSALDDVSKAGTPAYDLLGTERWRFVQFGDTIYVSGGINEEMQKFQIGVDSVFSDVSGAPRADFIAVVRDFVWTANIDTGSGRKPYRVYWSAFGDPTGWTSGTGQSDFQDIPDAGAITGMVGGEYCTILMERAIVRATYSGLPLVFQFDKVETARGCQVSGSVCNIGHTVFYLSDDGFYAFDGQSSSPIGSQKIDRFFFEDFDFSFKNKMTSTVDPQAQLAVWSYVSNSSLDGTPDRLLALPASLDSALYKGGQYLFGGALGTKIHAFTGDPLEGVIETGETSLAMGKHAIVTRVYPYHEGGTVNVEVGTRNIHTEDATFSTALAPNVDGFVPVREQGRYHRVRLNISGQWSVAQGIDVEAREIGRR